MASIVKHMLYIALLCYACCSLERVQFLNGSFDVLDLLVEFAVLWPDYSVQ